MEHSHKVKHYPKTDSRDGWGVCECGATISIVGGEPMGGWVAYL